MDDGPRVGMLKAAIIVGFLIIGGAGCVAPKPPQSDQPLVTSVESSNTSAPETRVCYNDSGEIDCAITDALEQHPLIVKKQAEGWRLQGVVATSTSKGDVIYFSMFSWDGIDKYSNEEKPFIAYSEHRLAPNLLGFWQRSEKDPIFSPLIGITSQGDIATITEEGMELLPALNRYGIVISAESGGGDGPFGFRTTIEFDPEKRSLTLRKKCSSNSAYSWNGIEYPPASHCETF